MVEKPKAFPTLGESGMDLRDWFAGQALAGQVTNPEFASCNEEQMAQASYRLADAMLAERSK